LASSCSNWPVVLPSVGLLKWLIAMIIRSPDAGSGTARVNISTSLAGDWSYLST
jgi:hypothetical protein